MFGISEPSTVLVCYLSCMCYFNFNRTILWDLQNVFSFFELKQRAPNGINGLSTTMIPNFIPQQGRKYMSFTGVILPRNKWIFLLYYWIYWICCWWLVTFTKVNHHFWPPFGRTCFGSLFPFASNMQIKVYSSASFIRINHCFLPCHGDSTGDNAEVRRFKSGTGRAGRVGYLEGHPRTWIRG